MFDLDRFKAINDRHGHAVGDAVIMKFCEVTVTVLRPTDLFARMGGEEFVILVPAAGIEAACMRAERIRISFADSCRFVDGRQVNATVSGGVAVSANGAEALEALLKSSDLAVYAAKEEGRNWIRCADAIAREGGTSHALRIA
jgi:diguanylate cyclase (GGDEF)-like protein